MEEMKQGLPTSVWRHSQFLVDTWNYLQGSLCPSLYYVALVSDKVKRDKLLASIKYRPEIEEQYAEIKARREKSEQDTSVSDVIELTDNDPSPGGFFEI